MDGQPNLPAVSSLARSTNSSDNSSTSRPITHDYDKHTEVCQALEALKNNSMYKSLIHWLSGSNVDKLAAAQFFTKQNQPKAAYVIYESLANQYNDSEANYQVGFLLSEGRGVDQDFSKAIDYLKKSTHQQARMKCGEAYYHLAVQTLSKPGFIINALGVNEPLGIYYFQQAIELSRQGNPEIAAWAAIQIGGLYQESHLEFIQTVKDYPKAVIFFEKAIELAKGITDVDKQKSICARANFGLGRIYSEGQRGEILVAWKVSPDQIKAATCFNLAIQNGLPEKMLEEAQATHAQIIEFLRSNISSAYKNNSNDSTPSNPPQENCHLM